MASQPPPYRQRSDYVERILALFDDGGEFPEINSSKTVLSHDDDEELFDTSFGRTFHRVNGCVPVGRGDDYFNQSKDEQLDKGEDRDEFEKPEKKFLAERMKSMMETGSSKFCDMSDMIEIVERQNEAGKKVLRHQ